MNKTLGINPIIFWLSLFGIILPGKAFSQVWTHDCPGGEDYKSPDYEVSIIQVNINT